jgi:hypothetical protein
VHTGKAAGASAADVNITDIGTMGSINGRRQQAAAAQPIRVGISIKAYSEAGANSMTKALTLDKINGELSKVNLPQATVLEPPKVAVAGGGECLNPNPQTLTPKP